MASTDTPIDHRPGYGELMVNATTLECASEVDVHQPLSLNHLGQKTGKEVLHVITFPYISLHLHFIALHLHFITFTLHLHFITFTLHLHYIYITFHYISLHLHFITFHYISLRFITFHYISLRFITLHLITFTFPYISVHL